MKTAIENSDKIFNENINKGLSEFFSCSDILFKKEIKKDTDFKKTEKTKALENLVSIQKKNIQKNFEDTKKKISTIFNERKINILQIINSEIDNSSDKLKEVNNDIKLASENLKSKIDNIYQKIKDDIANELSNLIKEIEKEEEIDNNCKNKNFNLSSSEINTKIGLGQKMFTSLITSSIITIAGEITLSETVLGATASGIVGGPIGIAIGLAVGVVISLTTLLIFSLRKNTNYKEGLKKLRENIEEELYEAEKDCLEVINLIEDDFNKKLNLKLAAMQKDIDILIKKIGKILRRNIPIKNIKFIN